MAWSSVKKKIDLDKKWPFYELLKTWKSYFLAVHLCRWSQHRHAQICDVDSGTCDFRLDSSCLFYLCKFSFVVHTKCSFPAFCTVWTTKVKFAEVKQARWVKPEVTRSLIYIRHNSFKMKGRRWWTKMAANLNVFKTYKKDCILSKSNFSFTEVHWVIYRII